jgi:hypothetical protein
MLLPCKVIIAVPLSGPDRFIVLEALNNLVPPWSGGRRQKTSFLLVASEVAPPHAHAFCPKCTIVVVLIGRFFLLFSVNAQSCCRDADADCKDWVKKSVPSSLLAKQWQEM